MHGCGRSQQSLDEMIQQQPYFFLDGVTYKFTGPKSKNMASYRPIQLKVNELSNDPAIRAVASIGISLNALSDRELAYCGNCKGPVYYSADNSKQDIVCGQCGSEIDWQGFVTLVNFCPTCNQEQSITNWYCTRHYPAVKLEMCEKK